MLKHLLAFLILSALLVIGLNYAHIVLEYLLSFYQLLLEWFGQIFTGGQLGYFLKHFIALALTPAVIGGIIGLIYWAIKRAEPPYLIPFIWVLWLILATSIILH